MILAVSWNALVGFCGLVSIGQQAFFGLGAYAAVRLADAGISVYPSLFAGALIVGLPSRRCRSSCCDSKGVSSRSACGWRPNWRISGQSRHACSGRDRNVPDRTQCLFDRDAPRASPIGSALAAMFGLLAIVFWLLRSPLGAAIQAIRDNEEAAESVGVRVAGAKRLVFTLAAFGAALAGALWVATALTFQPRAYFSPLWTAYMIFMALVGGLGTFEGAILGASFSSPSKPGSARRSLVSRRARGDIAGVRAGLARAASGAGSKITRRCGYFRLDTGSDLLETVSGAPTAGRQTIRARGGEPKP